MTAELVGDKVEYLLATGWFCTSVGHLPATLPNRDRWLWWTKTQVAKPIPMDAAILLQQAEDKKELLL